MIIDLDGFWPVRPGSSSVYHRALYGPAFHPMQTPGWLLPHVAAALMTDGWRAEGAHPATFWSMLMCWRLDKHPAKVGFVDWILEQYRADEEVLDLARANALSVTREDGLDWLRVILKRKPKYFGPVPVWTRRALREWRDESGLKAHEMEHILGVGVKGKLASWVGDHR